jgi:hypothetical protein
LLQSDLDVNHFNLLNFSGGGGAGGLPEGWVSVMDYGAAADGVTDDTAAARAAIAAATAVVYFPPGNYFFAGSIGAVPANISLVGSFEGPHGAVVTTNFFYDQSNQLSPLAGGTTFLLTANSGNANGTPFISITDNCAVNGITFYWPNQLASAGTPTAYPWAIHFDGGTAGSVKYCNFVNGYQCIYIENTIFSLVEEVRGQALFRGIKCEGNYDVTRLIGCHFNVTWDVTGVGAWSSLNAIAFDFGRNDMLIAQNCFAFSYGTWMHFYDDVAHNFHSPSSSWAEIRGGGADWCQKPIWVEQVQPQGIDFDGIHSSNNQTSPQPNLVVDSSNTGSVRIHNSMFLAWNGKFGTVAGSGNVMVDNCHCIADPNPGTTPAVFAATGWAVTGTGNFALRTCAFRTTQTHLSLGASLTRAVVTDNLCSDVFQVTNSMAAGFAVIANNTGGGTVYIGADARLVAISGGAKLQARNTSTGTWADVDQWTNP